MRKNKKTIGSHALGNRTVIGIICIVAALAICFGIAPVVNKLRDGKTAVVRVVRTVEKGKMCIRDRSSTVRPLSVFSRLSGR